MSTQPRPSASSNKVETVLVEPRDLTSTLAAPLLHPDGRVQDPAVLVDLDGAPSAEAVGAAREAASGAGRILVGVSRAGEPDAGWRPLVRALDLTIVPAGSTLEHRELVGVADPVESAGHLARAVRASPRAAITLAGLLRWSGAIDVPAALDAESHAYSMLLGGSEFADWLARRGARPLPPTASEPVLLRREGDELLITLNKPERRNAYDAQLRDALVAALELVGLDETIRTARLDGAGPTFCSGGDLAEFGTTPDPVFAHLVRTRAGAALPLHRVAERVEVHLHGACVGAGIELPAYAGRVVAAPDTRIRLPEVEMGLIPGAGGTVSIRRRIGRWRTLYLALSGAWIDAHTALAWGLVDDVAPQSRGDEIAVQASP